MDTRRRTDFFHVCNIMLPKQGLRLHFYQDSIDGVIILFKDLNIEYQVDDDTYQKLLRLTQNRSWSSSSDQMVEIWPLPNDHRFVPKWLADRIGKFLISVEILVKNPS